MKRSIHDYTPEQNDWFIDNSIDTFANVAAAFNKEFGANISKDAARGRIEKLGPDRADFAKMRMLIANSGKHTYTHGQDLWITNNRHFSYTDLEIMFNDKFKPETIVSKDSIRHRLASLGVQKRSNQRVKPGRPAIIQPLSKMSLAMLYLQIDRSSSEQGQRPYAEELWRRTYGPVDAGYTVRLKKPSRGASRKLLEMRPIK